MLRFPRALWLVGVLALLIAIPSAFGTFYCDDFGFVARLEDKTAPADSFHLYTFMTGNPGQRHALVDHGPLPWWTSDDRSLDEPSIAILAWKDGALRPRHKAPRAKCAESG